MQDSYFDNEIASLKTMTGQFKQSRKTLDAKMEQIVSGTYKKDVPIAPATYSANPSRNIADYKRSASDTILDATANCIVMLGETHPQITREDATKYCQEIAAQSTKPGGIYHITTKSAAVEQKVPAWLRSNLIHRQEYEHDIIYPPTQNIKSASVEDEEEREYDINAPAWLKTHDANRMTRTMSEHRFEKPKQDEPELTRQQSLLKQASTATATLTDIKGEPTKIQKRVARLMGMNGFV